MGERLLKKYRALFSKGLETLSEWESTQVLTVALVSSSSNIIKRLPVLTDDTNFGEFCDEVELIEAVKGKQMEALSSNIQRLREQICIFHRLSGCLERLALEGRQIFQDLKPQQTTLGGIRRGGSPSICECQEGLEDLSRIHRDECNLKSALVKGLTLDTSAAELDQILVTILSHTL